MTSQILWGAMEAAVITGGRTSGEWLATGVSISLQDIKPGDLFFAAPGDDTGEAFRKGCAAVVTACNRAEHEGLPVLKVADVYEALRSMARAGRFRTHATVIAVQGRAERQQMTRMLSAVGETHGGSRHLSQGLAAMPVHCEFAVFGFSPAVRPDIAIITNGHAVEEFCFEAMNPAGHVLVSGDDAGCMAAIARARAAGIRNIYTFGTAPESDAACVESLSGANGARMTLKILGEEIKTVMPAGVRIDNLMLAAMLVLKLTGSLERRLGMLLPALPQEEEPETNLSLISQPESPEAAFMVKNVIDLGGGRRTAILDDLGPVSHRLDVRPGKGPEVPWKLGNLEFVYACRGPSFFVNAETAIKRKNPSASLEKIVHDVLAPGDFVVFKDLWDSSRALISEALRMAPTRKTLTGIEAGTGHAL